MIISYTGTKGVNKWVKDIPACFSNAVSATGRFGNGGRNVLQGKMCF